MLAGVHRGSPGWQQLEVTPIGAAPILQDFGRMKFRTTMTSVPIRK